MDVFKAAASTADAPLLLRRPDGPGQPSGAGRKWAATAPARAHILVRMDEDERTAEALGGVAQLKERFGDDWASSALALGRSATQSAVLPRLWRALKDGKDIDVASTGGHVKAMRTSSGHCSRFRAHDGPYQTMRVVPL